MIEKNYSLEQQLKQTNEEIAAIRYSRAEQEPKAQEYRLSNMEITNTLRECKKQAQQVTREIQDLKLEKQELESKIENNEFLINNGRQEIARLKARIVHSPEQLKQVWTREATPLTIGDSWHAKCSFYWKI